MRIKSTCAIFYKFRVDFTKRLTIYRLGGVINIVNINICSYCDKYVAIVIAVRIFLSKCLK